MAIESCCSMLKGHLGYVYVVAFLPDGQLVASVLDDNMVWLWEMATGSCCSMLEGHLGFVHTVAFLLDGQLIASVL